MLFQTKHTCAEEATKETQHAEIPISAADSVD